MFLFDGPPRVEGGMAVWMPSMTYDIDVVRDVHQILERDWEKANEESQGLNPGSPAIPHARIEISPPPGVEPYPPQVVPVEQLPTLGGGARRRLQVAGPYGSVELRAGTRTIVYSGDEQIRSELVTLLLHEGRQRVQWRRLLGIGPIYGAALVLAAWIWVLASTGLTPALIFFGSVVVAAVFLVAMFSTRGTWVLYAARHSGARFREGSRSDVRARLANAKASTIVSLIAGPVGAVIGAVIGYFLKAWLH